MDERYFSYINKILAFYENEQSIDFENGIFKEGSSEDMVLQRLERAVKDEACGNLLHSRYAIWAHDLINILAAAKVAVKRHDNPDALRQIDCALKAIKAYKDILAIFDGDFYNLSDIVYTANVLYELRQLETNNLPYPSTDYPNIKVFYPYRLTQKIFNKIGVEYAKRFSQFYIPRGILKAVQNNIIMAVRPSMRMDIEKAELYNGLFIYSMWCEYRASNYQKNLKLI